MYRIWRLGLSALIAYTEEEEKAGVDQKFSIVETKTEPIKQWMYKRQQCSAHSMTHLSNKITQGKMVKEKEYTEVNQR